MKTIKILPGQTLIDLAIQELGDPSRLIEIAVLNNASPTEELAAGSFINVPDYDLSMRSTVNLFSTPSNAPSSADIDNEFVTKEEGIGYWIIGNDFKVS
jgi:hypothetical protein